MDKPSFDSVTVPVMLVLPCDSLSVPATITLD